MSINISETVLTVANFFLLFFILRTFLYRPLQKIMDARRANISDGLEKRESARRATEASDRLMLERLQAVSGEAKQLISQSKAEAAHGRAELLREAAGEAARIRAEAFRQIAREEEDAVRLIDENSAELLGVLTSRLLVREDRAEARHM